MSLHWIVPARRAVLRGSVTYADLMRAWVTELGATQPQMSRWYPIQPPGYVAGIASITQWLTSSFPQAGGVPAARGATTTLDRPALSFHVRLWKGPLRVLLEAAAHPVPLGNAIDDPSEIEVQHGGPVRLVRNQDGEVTNTEARFLVGDVVEFPLWKFLGAAGASGFGSASSYTDVLRFNGEGSFLLGTAVKSPAGASPPDSPLLHDNLVAMRFQVLVNGGLGAYYHLDQPVFQDQARALAVPDGGRTVYARGWIYAGTLGRPNLAASARQPEHWRVVNHGWCVAGNDEFAGNVPSIDGLAKLSDGFPVTTGMTCSPTTLFLSYYMMRHFAGGVYGGGSVGKTMLTMPRADIRRTFEFLTHAQVGEMVPSVPEEELRAQLARLIERVGRGLSKVDGEQSFMRQKLAAAVAAPAWTSGVRPATQSALEGKVNDPKALLDKVNELARARRTPPEEVAALEQLHASLVQGAQEFRDELVGLLDAPEWSRFTSVAPDFSNRSNQGHVAKVRAITCSGGSCRQPHDFRSINSLRDQLRAKQRNLERRSEDRRPLGAGRRGLTIDFSEHLSDVNTVSLNGHEFAIVKLYPHAKLLHSQQLPRAGHMAAYNPLSGKPYWENDYVQTGQFVVFEEGDRLFVWGGEKTRNAFGCGPLKWQKIPNNRCRVEVSGSTVFFGDGETVRQKTLQGLARLQNRGATPGPLAEAHLRAPAAFSPVLIHPIRGASSGAGYDAAMSRLVQQGMRMYASRSVPFPTLAEVADAFPTKEATRRQQELARAAAETAIASKRTELTAAQAELARAPDDRQKQRSVNELTRQIDGISKFIAALTPAAPAAAAPTAPAAGVAAPAAAAP